MTERRIARDHKRRQTARVHTETAGATAIRTLPVVTAVGVKASGRLDGRSDRMIHRSEAGAPSSGTPDLDPVLDFMRLLWNVEHRLQSTSKWMEATLGITGPQRLVLRIVSQRPGLSAGELARIVHLHPSTITGILQRLVKKDLLRRERDRRDSRRIRLRSRAAASGFIAASPGTVESAVTYALARIPMHRVRHAREVLSAIAEALADDRGQSATASISRANGPTERRSDRAEKSITRANRAGRGPGTPS